MRMVPRRVVCYYKFNAKSWWKKMREGGFSIWNGSIHLPFLLVSKCAQSRRRRKKTQRNESWAQSRRVVSYRATQWRIFYSWSVSSGYTEPLFIAFIREDMKELFYAPVNSHFCSQCLLQEGKLFIWQSFTHAPFFSVIQDESTCVITDNIFHSLSVVFYCCCVSLSVKRTALERHHCLDLRCQWRRGRIED